MIKISLVWHVIMQNIIAFFFDSNSRREQFPRARALNKANDALAFVTTHDLELELEDELDRVALELLEVDADFELRAASKFHIKSFACAMCWESGSEDGGSNAA